MLPKIIKILITSIRSTRYDDQFKTNNLVISYTKEQMAHIHLYGLNDCIQLEIYALSRVRMYISPKVRHCKRGKTTGM